MYLSLSIYISLSLSIYIYIYIHTYNQPNARAWQRQEERQHMMQIRGGFAHPSVRELLGDLKGPRIPQKRFQAQGETPREQGDTMCIMVFGVYYGSVFSESLLGFGISSREFRDRMAT